MPIYDREKMKQKVVYPTRQTPSYADWKLFEMGADLEDKVDSIPASEPYTPGSGIAISEENVISNTAQPDVTKAYVDGVDVNLQQQIDAIVASSDVKDIVGTYADLQAYDTSTLGNNDIIKVLVDSTHSDAMGYYRWVITEGVGAWSYIGSEGPYYTKSQVDTELNDKLDKDFSNADVGQATAGQVLTVNSSANGVEFVTPTKELPTIASGDAGKVLAVNLGETGVEWQSIVVGGGYEFVSTSNNFREIAPNNYRSVSISLDINYDYLIITSPYNNNTVTCVLSTQSYNTNSINIMYYNKSGNTNYAGVTYYIYRRPKAHATNVVNVIGSVSNNAVFIPTGGAVNQVFKKNGSGYAEGSWQNIREVPSSSASDIGKVLSVTDANTYGWVTAGGSGGGLSAHTYNTYKELADDFVLHPDAILVSNNDFQLRLTDNNTKIRITSTWSGYNSSAPSMTISRVDETYDIDSTLEVSSLSLPYGYCIVYASNSTLATNTVNIGVSAFKLLY